MSKKWLLVLGLFGIGALSLLALGVVIHEMDRVPAGMQAAPNPSKIGIIQLVAAALSAFGFTSGGVIVTVINLWNSWHGGSSPYPVNPSNPITPEVPSGLDDLIVAFPEWVSDRNNPSKSRRFWFDLCEVGISIEPDQEIREWLQSGATLLVKKYFPPINQQSSSGSTT